MLVALALLSASASASPVSPDTIDAEWRAMQVLRVRPESYRVVKEPFTITEGPLELTIRDGVLVPVFSGFHAEDPDGIEQARQEAFERDGRAPPPLEEGDVAFVGFVFTGGSASFEVTWQERADALIFANHQVTNLRQDPASWAEVAHGAPWTGEATEGIVLGLDPEILAGFLGPDDAEGSPTDVVVYGERDYTAARLRARVLFHDRREAMKRRGMSPSAGVASDRVAAAHGLVTAGAHHLVDLHIDRNLGTPYEPRHDQPTDVDWMTLSQDWTGGQSTRRHTTLSALDVGQQDRLFSWDITGVPFDPVDPADPKSPRLPPVRLEVAEASVMVPVVPITAQLRVEPVARLRLRAVGGDFQVVQLDVPVAGSRHDWKLLSVTRSDGASLLSSAPLITWATPDAGTNEAPGGDQGDKTPTPMTEGALRDQAPNVDRPDVRPLPGVARVTLSLPSPVRAGEELVVDVAWKDVWPFGAPTVVERGLGFDAMTLVSATDAASGQQRVVPTVVGLPDPSFPYRVDVLVPERTALLPAISGRPVPTTTAEGWERHSATSFDGPASPPVVALGTYRSVVDTRARPRLTSFAEHRDQDQEALLAETRTELGFFEGFLAPFPWPDHTLALGGRGITAGHAFTGVGRVVVRSTFEGAAATRESGNLTTQLALSRALAQQWFGQSVRAVDPVDRGVLGALAEGFGILYVGARGGDTSTVWREKRQPLETMFVDPVNRRSMVDPRFGPFVLDQMLRPRLGDAAYFGAIDLFSREYAGRIATTEDLLRAFELTSGQDLDPFFDFWVFGGFVPREVRLAWDWSGGRFTGRVTTDVPFGTFDVPIVVDGVEHLVVVTDGAGEVVADTATEPLKVELDPGFRILTRDRTTRREAAASPPR